MADHDAYMSDAYMSDLDALLGTLRVRLDPNELGYVLPDVAALRREVESGSGFTIRAGDQEISIGP